MATNEHRTKLVADEPHCRSYVDVGPLDVEVAIALERALAYVTDVRDLNPSDVHRSLRALPRLELEQVAVILAALVPDDRPARELLAWLSDEPLWATRRLAPHGSHAAYNRHRKRREAACEACLRAEARRGSGQSRAQVREQDVDTDEEPDLVAVERAVNGERVHLTRTEKALAAQRIHAAGGNVAALLHVSHTTARQLLEQAHNRRPQTPRSGSDTTTTDTREASA